MDILKNLNEFNPKYKRVYDKFSLNNLDVVTIPESMKHIDLYVSRYIEDKIKIKTSDKYFVNGIEKTKSEGIKFLASLKNIKSIRINIFDLLLTVDTSKLNTLLNLDNINDKEAFMYLNQDTVLRNGYKVNIKPIPMIGSKTFKPTINLLMNSIDCSIIKDSIFYYRDLHNLVVVVDTNKINLLKSYLKSKFLELGVVLGGRSIIIEDGININNLYINKKSISISKLSFEFLLNMVNTIYNNNKKYEGQLISVTCFNFDITNFLYKTNRRLNINHILIEDIFNYVTNEIQIRKLSNVIDSYRERLDSYKIYNDYYDSFYLPIMSMYKYYCINPMIYKLKLKLMLSDNKLEDVKYCECDNRDLNISESVKFNSLFTFFLSQPKMDKFMVWNGSKFVDSKLLLFDFKKGKISIEDHLVLDGLNFINNIILLDKNGIIKEYSFNEIYELEINTEVLENLYIQAYTLDDSPNKFNELLDYGLPKRSDLNFNNPYLLFCCIFYKFLYTKEDDKSEFYEIYPRSILVYRSNLNKLNSPMSDINAWSSN